MARLPLLYSVLLLQCICICLLLPSAAAFFTTSSNAPIGHLFSAPSAALGSTRIPTIRRPSVALQVSSKTTTTEEKTTTVSRSDQDLQLLQKDLERSLANVQSGTTARRVLEQALLNDNNNKNAVLYQSIVIPPDSSSKGLSDGDLAIRTRIRNTKYSIFDVIDLNGNRDADRASLAVLGTMVASTLSALVANQNLPGPEILRFLVVWLFSFAPLALVGYGIATPDKLQAALVNVQRLVFPNYRQRMVQHEAGHALMGHLLGFPIQTYQANAVKNAVSFYPLNDPTRGTDRAQQLGFDKTSTTTPEEQDSFIDNTNNNDAAFFSSEGRGKDSIEQQSVFRKEEELRKTNYTAFLQIDTTTSVEMDATQSWPYRTLDDSTLDKLAVISVAGVCAEILAFGNAEGGLADFNQLKQLLVANADEEMTQREVDNRIRFALGYTMSQLRGHLAALDALAAVMERDGSIAECVVAMESCASNPSGNDGILEDYESRRKREQFEASSANNNPLVRILEPLFLGEIKTANVQEDRLVEGKGGGYRKQAEPLITGDDPLYLALGAATVFLLWASSGGLSLH